MTRRQTYYELFGLDEHATPLQIRAAYLRLIKQHHPDLAHGSGSDAQGDLVPILNSCYAVLREPKKKAAYDAELARRQPDVCSLPARHHLYAAPSPRLSLLGTAVAIMFAVSIGVALQFALTRPADASWIAFRSLWPQPHAFSSRSMAVKVTTQQVQHEAQLAMLASDDRAVLMSHNCFENAAEKHNLEAAELCVVFDEAFLYWRGSPDHDLNLPVYFTDPVTQIRHTESLASLGSGAEPAVEELHEKAFRALLRQVTVSGAEAVDRAAPAATNEVGDRPNGAIATFVVPK